MPEGDGAPYHETGDDFDAEVSDTRPGAPGGSPESRGRGPTPFAPRQAPRRRALRQAGIIGAVLLALAVTLGGVPGVRERAIGVFVPAPTPTIGAGGDLFYLLPNPPGVEVS